jgi:hypothetical protein
MLRKRSCLRCYAHSQNSKLKVTFLSYMVKLLGGRRELALPWVLRLEKVLHVLQKFGFLLPAHSFSSRLFQSKRKHAGTIVNPKLSVNRPHVPANCITTNKQGIGNLPVRMACSQQG